MELHGNDVLLTGSEAGYIQRAAVYGQRYPLAQRILEARAAFVRPHLSAADALPNPMPSVRSSERTGPPEEMVLLLLAIQRAEVTHGQDLAGAERHIVQTTLDDEELGWLRDGAAEHVAITREDLSSGDSHAGDPEEKVDPNADMTVVNEAYIQESFTEAAVASGIVRAIDAARGTPPGAR